jgi:hypothetical protein
LEKIGSFIKIFKKISLVFFKEIIKIKEIINKINKKTIKERWALTKLLTIIKIFVRRGGEEVNCVKRTLILGITKVIKRTITPKDKIKTIAG